MIVVSDTSPLNYLVLIDFQQILPQLFERILIPQAVRQELESPATPDAIRRFLATEPEWLETRLVSEIDPPLRQLDLGEREAIALALSTSASRLLVDEKRGRDAARANGLSVAGTLAVLDLGARRGLLDLSVALERLEKTTFRVSPRLLRYVREGRPR
ncbi:MAG TPA: DUF3368 domain-containing protein [Vicinamibacterales bacterium]|jgi:predicted nucleic acid-binding protein|nr:DUF3368 domain-containing protein [Vicinamibacterales bacterium]